MCSMTDLCFMCLKNDNNCSVVDNKIVIQVEYLMPEIKIIKLRLPLRACVSCIKKLDLFSTFKKDCVENSLRLELWIKEKQDNTDLIEKCTTSETNINKIHEVYIKEEVLDERDNLDVRYSLNEISVKEDPIQENSYDQEMGHVLQDIVKEERSPQTDTHIHEDSNVDIDDQSDLNSADTDDVVSLNNKINSGENILVTDSAGRKIYTCLICNKGFKDLSYLRTSHMKIHIGKKDFQCNECKKWFSQKSNLATHMKKHIGDKKFQCNECKKWFLHKTTLVRHMKQHTGIKFQCNECRKWFSDKSNLSRHMNKHAGVKFQCNECKKWFSDKSTLATHMKQHTGIKDFQCNECKKWFSQKSTLVRHMYQHNGVKFQCNECKKWFSDKSNLAAHMKQHTKCVICNVMFCDKSKLNKHMEIHAQINSGEFGM